MMRLLSLCMLLAAATAFTSPQPWGTSKSVAASSSQRFMFSADDDTKKADVAAAAPALATMDTPVAAAASSAEEEQAKNFVRNMNTGELREVKWVDPAMSANTNPLRMSWYVTSTRQI